MRRIERLSHGPRWGGVPLCMLDVTVHMFQCPVPLLGHLSCWLKLGSTDLKYTLLDIQFPYY